MKPFFEPFFKPFFGAALPTRIGQIIGKSRERVMMSKAGGPDGIRKNYGQNPDGSTTMLKTRAGMPQFSTPKTIAGSPTGITVLSDSDVLLADDPNTAYLEHLVTLPRTYGTARTYAFDFINDTSGADLAELISVSVTGFTDGVFGSRFPDPYDPNPSVITVPAGVATFTVTVAITCIPYTDPHITYRIFVGDAFGTGSAEAI